MAGLGRPNKPIGVTTLGGLFEPAGVTTLGGGLSELARRLVIWKKAHPDPQYDPAVFRKDDFGWWIKYDDYGKHSSDYGWEIDHIRPKSLGGSDHLSNLRPLHHRVNSSLGGGISGLFK